MEEKQSQFQRFIRQNPIIVCLFVILQIVFIVLVIFTIRGANTNNFKEPDLQINNLTSDIKDLPDSSSQAIQTALYDAIISNDGALQSIKQSDAKIREGTLINTYFERQNMHYVNFIVDITSIEQSYQVFHEWSNDDTNQYYLLNNTTLVMCPLAEQVIYTQFNCHDNMNRGGQKFIVSNFIDYFDFDYFSAFVGDDDPPIIYINTASSNTTKHEDENYVAELKSKISSLGISPEIFEYEIITQKNLNYNIFNPSN